MKAEIGNIIEFKKAVLDFANQFEICCLLDSNQHQDKYGKFEFLAAFGTKNIIEIETNSFDAFQKLQKFKKDHAGWIFGGFSYDLKNEIEDLSSKNLNSLEFPNLFFFAPEHIIIVKNNESEIISESAKEIHKILLESIKIEENTND